MINKPDLWKSLFFTALICLLAWDAIIWLSNPAHRLPEQHRQMLLAALLLWFASVFSTPNRDDDWAGEF